MGIPLLTPKILRDEHTMTILIWKSISYSKEQTQNLKFHKFIEFASNQNEQQYIVVLKN